MKKKKIWKKNTSDKSYKMLIGVILVLVTCIGLCGCTTYSGYSEYTPEELYNAAVEDLNNGDYCNAIGTFEEIIYSYPDSNYSKLAKGEIPRCYYEWGEELEDLGYYSDAVEKFSIIIHSYPGSVYESRALEKILEIDEHANVTSTIPSPDCEYVGGNYTHIVMKNEAYLPVTIIFNGPSYENVQMNPDEIISLTLDPGVYYLVGTASGVIPFTGVERLSIGYEYSWEWFIQYTYY